MNNGFLDINMVSKVQNYRDKNSDAFSFLFRVNDFLYRIEDCFPRKNPTKIDAYIFSTFIEIHISYQSIVLLLERGLYTDSQILIRSLYDKIIKSLYVLSDNNNFLLLNLSDNEEKIKIVKFVLNHKNIFTDEVFNNYKKILPSLENNRQYKNGKIMKSHSIRDICEKLNVSELYFPYMFLSDYTHNSGFVVSKRLFKKDKDIWIDRGFEYSDNFLFEINLLFGVLKYIVVPICRYIHNDNLINEFNNMNNDFELLFK